VILGGIYGVDSNCVDTELLEKKDITSTLISIGQGVSSLFDISGTTRLVIDTFDEELLLSYAIDEVSTLELNCVNGSGHTT